MPSPELGEAAFRGTVRIADIDRLAVDTTYLFKVEDYVS